MGNKTNTSTSDTTSKNESWLLTDTGIKDLINNAINNAGNLPELGWADMTPEQMEALQGIMGGRDWGQLGAGAGWMGQMGQGAAQSGMNQWNQYMDKLQGAFGEGGILTQGGYQDAINNMYNSDLVNQQLGVAGTAIQNQLESNLQGINQRAVSGGGMGSSRAGVAEGVAHGKAADAMANATAQIQGNAYAQAIQGANQQAGNILGGLNMGIGAGQGMLGQGSNIMNQGMGWGSNILGGQMEDKFNQFGAGSIIQQWNQGKLDRDYWNQLQSSTGGLSTLLPIIGGTAGWGGTSNSTTTGSQTTGSGNFWGGLAGSALGAAGSYFGKSDKRLKKNIKKADKKDGVQWYTWEWNDKAKELGIESQPTYGVIAQEVKEKFPDAVRMGEDGFYEVDYSKL
ncbi:MAG: tail fiber domain-containing protein [Cetobacterium sp.]|uniref:tail fiber domain-containing protein n=1 Tax=Cetobacterium sp. TaxID=2071632 RepID=UPI003EE8136F